MLAMLEIADLADRAPYQLSGGQKKRVAIASVLVMNPEVLLFDEPTAALDPRTQQWLIELIVELNRAGKTIVLATHDLDVLDWVADRCLVFSEEHRIVAEGTPDEVLDDRDTLLAGEPDPPARAPPRPPRARPPARRRPLRDRPRPAARRAGAERAQRSRDARYALGMTVRDKAAELRRLHDDPDLLVMVNVWDVVSAHDARRARRLPRDRHRQPLGRRCRRLPRRRAHPARRDARGRRAGSRPPSRSRSAPTSRPATATRPTRCAARSASARGREHRGPDAAVRRGRRGRRRPSRPRPTRRASRSR